MGFNRSYSHLRNGRIDKRAQKAYNILFYAAIVVILKVARIVA